MACNSREQRRSCLAIQQVRAIMTTSDSLADPLRG